MEEKAEDREANNSDNVSLVTLNLFDHEDEPSANKFELSDVKRMHEKRNSIDRGKKSFVKSGVAALNISDEFADIKNAHEDVDSSGTREEKARRSLKISNIEIEDDSETLEKEDGNKIEEDRNENEEQESEKQVEGDEITGEETVGSFYRISRKFTIASDDEETEEVYEDIEEYETSTSDDFQQRYANEEILRVSDAELYATGTRRLTIARSGVIDRAASMLEQRLKIISSLKELYEERKKLALKNGFLHKKCCEFIKKTTTVDLFENMSGALPIHGNQRYHAVLEEYIATKIEYEKTKPILEQEILNLSDSYHSYRTRFEQINEDFKLRILEIGFQCVNAKSGKSLGEHRVRSLAKKQQGRSDDLANIRVQYLKLNHRLADIHAKMSKLNLMGEGQTLMDYEQLMIENSSHVDKLDEREEELLKLRNKCAQFISISSHMKETSDVFVYDIMSEAARLAELVQSKSEARTLLAIERSKRETLRKATSRIRHESGLIGSPIMLRKMRADLEALDFLKQRARDSM